MSQNVLVVFPHPDDEAFGVSGTILLHNQSGNQVTYICLTLGEMGRNMGRPLFSDRESLPAIRQKELLEACDILGIQDLRQFGYRDKTVEFEDQDELTERILQVIHEVKPFKIITFYPGYSVHPDHEACGKAVVHAVSQLPREQLPLLHCVAFSNNCIEELGYPDIIVDVSAVAKQKLAAIRAHRSQTQWIFEAMERDPDKVPDIIKRLPSERFWTYQWKGSESNK
jgi:bacillithiol biosynthesis deacetylase BshB2